MSQQAKRKADAEILGALSDPHSAEASANASANLAVAPLSTRVPGEVAAEFHRLLRGGDRDSAFQSLLNWLCSATPATGAAIAVQQQSAVVCVASGGTAPPIGVTIDRSSGLSGLCLERAETIVCDDAATDPRVNRAAGLYIRSVIAAPVLEESRATGLVEILSTEPFAFDVMHLIIVEATADFIATIDQTPQAAHVAVVQAPEPVPATIEDANHETAGIGQTFTFGESLYSTSTAESKTARAAALLGRSRELLVERKRLGAIVLAALALLVLVAWLTTRTRAPQTTASTVPLQQSAQAPVAESNVSEPRANSAPAAVVETSKVVSVGTTNSVPTRTAPAERPLRIAAPSLKAENTTSVADVAAPTLSFGSSAAVPVPIPSTPKVASVAPSQPPSGGELVHKVMPRYPMALRPRRLSGQVQLVASVNTSGRVSDVRVVSGDALLAQAAVDAVRQWRYTPKIVNGRPVEMDVPVTVNFRPPE